ncbi:MAG: response regulator [candidate division Zixibacteria bacterium]|nr:response regulator [Candidatus Tariuqbacter arcticus]
MPPLKKILLVDDEFAMRHILKSILCQIDDFDFIEASDGSQALDLMLKHKPDLVFLDIFMPRLSGVDTLRKISEIEELCAIPVIMCTAESSISAIKSAMMSGAVDYIVKPFTMETVKKKAKKWLFSEE